MAGVQATRTRSESRPGLVTKELLQIEFKGRVQEVEGVKRSQLSFGSRVSHVRGGTKSCLIPSVGRVCVCGVGLWR